MIVVGGVYQERCRFPRWDRIFGSGLRAALAISELSPGSELRSYVSKELEDDVAATLDLFSLRSRFSTSRSVITFEYLHPFERSGFTPKEIEQEPNLTVEGDVILRFGMMEGDARVAARRAVYDPQSPFPRPFLLNDSTSTELVIIATAEEVTKLAGQKPACDGSRPDLDDVRRAMVELFDEPTLRAVLLKDPLGGLTVFQGDEGTPARNYAAESYFRIGSGDILAAAFTHAWGEAGAPIAEAADFASRCLAYAVAGPRLPLDRVGIEALQPIPGNVLQTLRVVAGDALELQALALHTSAWIKHLGGKAILDFDGDPAEVPKESHAILVLVGETTLRTDILRLSRAATTGPVVVYWPLGDSKQAERYFPGAVLARDYSTALYRAMRMVPA